MRKLLSLAVTLLLLGMVLAAGVFLIPGFLGYELFPITDAQMEPRIQQGSLILGKPVQAQELQEGDMVIARQEGQTVVRKVTGRDESSQTLLVERGTSQPLEEEKVSYQEVWGRGEVTIPYLGILYELLHTEKGMMMAGIFLAGVVVLVVLLDFGSRRDKERDRYGRRDARSRYRDSYYR